MHHGGGHGHHGGERSFAHDPRSNSSTGGWNQKCPPTWSNELRTKYTLRQYAQDLILWSMQTDLYPHQQAASVITRLGGAAGDLCRGMSYDEITRGGPHPRTGVHLEPVAYILSGLQNKYGPLAEEERMAFMQAFTGFKRGRNEPIDDVITRFEPYNGEPTPKVGLP